MRKTIIFDFDGTIADSFIFIKNILLDLSSEFGYKKPTEKEIAVLRAKPPLEIFKYVGISNYKLPFLILRVQKEMHIQIENIRPIQGIEEALHDLKAKGFVLGIVSSNNSKNIAAFLKKNNLLFFDFIQSESSIFGKARVLHNVLKKHKIDKNKAIYVGDEIRDIEAAKKVGIKIISVSWGFNDSKGLEKYHPDALIDKPSQLLSSI